MKKIISAVVVAGDLVQISNAMGPTGDNTPRRFYKDQEWIWQKTPAEESLHNGKSVTNKRDPIHIWTPVTSALPVRPPLASALPVRPPLASALPVRPPLASALPGRPPLTSSLPLRPPVARAANARAPFA